MNASGSRLSRSVGELKPHYDVVVAGSGYGGAVTAARLASADKRVCVLERGRELRPGDYPDTLRSAAQEFQIDLPDRHLFSPTALYDLRINPDLSVFVGCGLGGTSLINANVALRPDGPVFESGAWPTQIEKEARTGQLTPWFDKAKSMLGVEEYPCLERPRKLRALDRVLKILVPGASECPKTPVTVTFPRDDDDNEVRPNPFGVMQRPCTGCGDCVSGCNYGAKNTLIMNYLPYASRHGAEIFTEVKVRSVEPNPGAAKDCNARWIVHFDYVGSGRESFGAPRLFVTAHTVILAAGALGSTEILFRSREEHGLQLSKMLGQRFSGNGDVLAFTYNDREPSNAVGFGARSPHGFEAPGPCISGFIKWPTNNPRILLQDGVIPGALSSMLDAGFVLARGLKGRDARTLRNGSLWSVLDEHVRGGVSSTQTFLAMLSDPDFGKLALEDDRIRVRWPGAGHGPPYEELERLLVHASAALEGVYVPSPFGRITVHPLGGCVMADGPDRGVVDHRGAVFASDGQFYEGLYVCDASIIPRALGANPLLTITALAERASPLIQ